MKGFFKKLLVIMGVIGLGLAVFVGIRIQENNRKAAVRQAEAQLQQVSPAEAQQLDLGGFAEGDFRVLAEPAAATPAPSPEQWRALRQALGGAGALPLLLPEQCPVLSPTYGRVRYAVKPDAWRVLIDCREGDLVGKNCEPVALAVAIAARVEGGDPREIINTLASEPPAVYAALHGHGGTDGQDRLIKEGNYPMIYNEFCSELGCNGSVSFAAGELAVKIEGGGDLQPWFTALAQAAAKVGGAKR